MQSTNAGDGLPLTTDIHLERRGAVLWIALARPDRLNAITHTMAAELLATFDALAHDPTVRVVLLRGRGRGFCAGLDIGHAKEWPEDAVRLPRVIEAMRRCPQPIIALVHGPACGGGLGLALAADVRLAGASARMNVAFVNLGVSGCEMGVSWFLPRNVGLSVASELMMTGRFIDAERALRTGLVSDVVADDELEATGAALADEMLGVAPLALAKTKETIGRVLEMNDLVAAMALEDETQRECMAGEDFDEGLQAFLEGRRPQFAGATGSTTAGEEGT
jgi:enoyl-CoA hydratase